MENSAGMQAGQPPEGARQFGNYRLLHLLAQDPFAEVYLGEHIFLKTQAAIKVVQAGLTHEELERFLAEVRIMARLKHPHIVRVLEFGVQAEQPFLVMDYTSNDSLRQLHPQGSSLPLTTILGYVRQIAPALQYAHDEGLLHGNLRPETILLGPHKQLLLSDFGTSVLDRSAIAIHLLPEMDQAAAEIVDYRAPEQLQGEPCAASDQYALAVMVYEWLGGWSPSHTPIGATRDQLLSAHTQPLWEATSSISPEVEQMLLKALAADPERRFATVSDFAHVLEEALRPAIEPLQPAHERPKQPTRRRSASLIIALIALVGVIVASTFLSSMAFFSSGPSSQVAATSTAQARLATVDARFAGQNPQDIYLHVTSAHPIIDDTLHQQAGSTWKDEHSTSGSCTFAGGAYHVVSGVSQHHCLSGSGNLSNFAFQVQMTIVKGDFGGICFRVGRSGTTFYDFALDPTGFYEVTVVGTSYTPLLTNGNIPVTKTILNQPYLMTVIATGSHFYFYLNAQYITDATSPSNALSSGQIGLVASAGTNPTPATEVVFSNVKVWNL